METPVTERKSRSYGWMYVLAMLLALGVLGAGIWLGVVRNEWMMLAAGAVSVLLVLTVWPLGLSLEAARKDQGKTIAHINTTLDDRLEQVSILLNLLSEQQLLSDRAKAVAFRDKDAEALRRAIREDISKCNWDSSIRLINEMESSFGYKQEAEVFRNELERCRGQQEQRVIGDVMATIDRAARSERWNDAQDEARKLQSQLPDNAQVRNLPAEIENRRLQHKQRLVESWHDAVARKDVDGSIEILKQLDMYLSPSEAQGLQETARSVFKEKLNLLKLQFAGAVQDRRWAEAVDLGEQITRDFPNTRIAQEVTEKMPTLRQRAVEPEAVKA